MAQEDMSIEAGLAIAFGAATAFFGTLDGVWLGAYKYKLVGIPDTQFGWIVFFAAVAALLGVACLSLLFVLFWRVRGPLFGYVWNILLGTWGVSMTAAVVVLLYSHFLSK